MEFESFTNLLFLFVLEENNCSDVIKCRFNVFVVLGKVESLVKGKVHKKNVNSVIISTLMNVR